MRIELLRVLSLAIVGIGMLTVCGRLLHWHGLHTWMADDPGMAVNTGLAFLLCGAGFLLVAAEQEEAARAGVR